MTTPPTDNSATPEVRLPAAGPGQMWGWRNWQAREAGYPPLGAVEYRLYTDCDLLSGEATEGLGPYQLFKTGTFVLTLGTVLPAVVLRANHYIYPALVLGGARGNSLELNIDTLRLAGTVDDKRNELSEDRPRNVDAYHGGHVADELASLVSLALGIRLESGGLTRVFPVDDDPRGRPIENFSPNYRPRRLNRFTPDRLIPRDFPESDDDASAAWSRLADCVPWLQRYFRLEQGQANALLTRGADTAEQTGTAAVGSPQGSSR